MPDPGQRPPTQDTPLPVLPIDYRPPPPPLRSTRFGLTAFCLSIFSLAFMAISFAMYRNLLSFHHRAFQLWIAWASIALGGISALLSPIALFFRRGLYEI